MRKIIFTCTVFAVATLWMSTGASAKNPSANFDNDLRTAKLLAAREGKPIIVDFHASWCTPCKIMQEYTFGNPQVQQYLKQNYISVSVDIDDLDGFALKKEFAVKMLPTVLFFNPSGKMVKKYEETLGASKMLDILAAYNNTKAREKANATLPALLSAPKPPKAAPRPSVAPAPKTYNETTTRTVVKPAAKIARVETNTAPKPANENYTNRYLAAKGVESLPASGYTIQVTSTHNKAFLDAFMEKEVEKKVKNQDVYVHEMLEPTGQVVIKVCVGKAFNYAQAQKLKEKLTAQGMKGCFIKKFSELR